MKIRTDFVTNSSSSSYIIAFKKFPEIEEDIIKKYPFLKLCEELLEYALLKEESYDETSEGIQIHDAKELEEYFMDYCFDSSFENLYNSSDYVKKLYDECVKYLNDGFTIIAKGVGYGNYRNQLFKKLQSDDFVIIEGD